MKRAFVAVLVAVMGLWLSVASASAATMDLLVTGKVTLANPPGGTTSPLAVDDIVTFHLTYTTPSTDSDAAAGHGFYKPFTTFETSFNGQTYSLDAPAVSFDVTDGAPDFIQIRYSGGPVNPKGFFNIDLGFSDPAGLLLADDSLPTDLVTLQAMTGTFGFFLFPPLTSGSMLPVIINGSITSVAAIATTPIPAALPLLMSALGGLGFAGWRRRKSRA